MLQITSGDGAYRRFDIVGNTADTLTVQQNETSGDYGREYTVADSKRYTNPFPAYEYELGPVETGDRYQIGMGSVKTASATTGTRPLLKCSFSTASCMSAPASTMTTARRCGSPRTAIHGRSPNRPTASATITLTPPTMQSAPTPAARSRFRVACPAWPSRPARVSPSSTRLDAGPVPRGGDGSTVTATGNADNQTSGGSFKFIADTEDWDNSIGINTPGQSGDPASPHYCDLFGLWAKGGYFPAAYSRRKVESVTESVTRLAPR